MQSLACAKKKVLKKLPAGKDVNDADVFKFNADFEDPRPKVHINSIQVKVSVMLLFLRTVTNGHIAHPPPFFLYHSLKNRCGPINLSRTIGNSL